MHSFKNRFTPGVYRPIVHENVVTKIKKFIIFVSRIRYNNAVKILPELGKMKNISSRNLVRLLQDHAWLNPSTGSKHIAKAAGVKCCSGVVFVDVGDSSGKSQKPLYYKLENLLMTSVKSSLSIWRLLPSYTSTEVVSGVSSKGKTFTIW